MSLRKLRTLAVFWCEGSPTEKAIELFDNLQDSYAVSISANDKDFKPQFEELLLLATQVVDEQRSAILNKDRLLSEDQLQEIQDKFDDLREEFLDEVFGGDAKLDRKEWETEVANKASWIFDPEQIRVKLGVKK